MKFINNEHEHFYNIFLQADKTRERDTERKALFYLLALTEETRKNINDFYEFENHRISFESINKPYQCSGSMAVTRLAFNLYNGFRGLEDDSYCKVTPENIFYIDEYRPYMIEALNIRYS